MVNIGVGPANAKTITDHIAVLRPMPGSCWGIAPGCAIRSNWVTMCWPTAMCEKTMCSTKTCLCGCPFRPGGNSAGAGGAVADVTQLQGYELKRIMRTGTVASTDNRNWELLPQRTPERRFSQSRAVALDMESATIAANGFRFRVPYGTLLCVSDKPLHGELKLPGMANQFYRERVDQHLRIGLRAIERLRANQAGNCGRKLRSFAEWPSSNSS